MTRFIRALAVFVAFTPLTACDGLPGLGDGGADDLAPGPDLALFSLKSGIYKVTAVRSDAAMDGCKINDGMLVNREFAITNTSGVGIKFGSVDTATMKAAADTGEPPQPTQGSACVTKSNPAECASEPDAVAFGANMGSFVRDNTVSVEMSTCKFKRHVHNLVTLTGNNKFTSKFKRVDGTPMDCMTMIECTSTFEWDLEYSKDFAP